MLNHHHLLPKNPSLKFDANLCKCEQGFTYNIKRTKLPRINTLSLPVHVNKAYRRKQSKETATDMKKIAKSNKIIAFVSVLTY